MNIEKLTNICQSLPAVNTDIKWENDLCFVVGEKIFCMVSLEKSPTSASFKASPEDYEELIAIKGFRSAPYLGRYKWVYADDISVMSKDQWRNYLEKSYQLIVAKLPKKVKAELGID